MQIPISLKSLKTFSTSLLFTLTVTVLLLNFVVFQFNTPYTKSQVQIIFLGAILDPFEMEKIKPQRILSPNAPAISPPNDQQTKNRTVTAPAKPNLSHLVTDRHKNIFKTSPLVEEKIKNIPLDISSETHKNPDVPQPYQRLKLYR